MNRLASIGFRQNLNRFSAPARQIAMDDAARWAAPHAARITYPARGVILGSLLGSGMWFMLAVVLASKGIL